MTGNFSVHPFVKQDPHARQLKLPLRLFGAAPPQSGGLPPLFFRLAQSRIFPMPGNKGDYDNLLQGIDSGAVTLEQVKINASRVVKMARALTQE